MFICNTHCIIKVGISCKYNHTIHSAKVWNYHWLWQQADNSKLPPILPHYNNNMWHLYSTLFSSIAALRCFTLLLSLTQTCSNPALISTPNGAYSACCHYRHKALLKHISITSCEVLIFTDEWTSCRMMALQLRSLEPATL